MNAERGPETWLEPDEPVVAVARARDVALIVSARRVLIVDDDRMLLNVPYTRLRRVQFDIERERPATLVVVPEHPADEPVVMPVPVEQYTAVAEALVKIGTELYPRPAGEPR